jgi:2-desacetyl-2-hydroxyethyl bacteriochlorophyllide A dehydrogenase
MKTQAIIFGEDHVARLSDRELPTMTDTRVGVEAVYSGISCGTETDSLTGRQIYVKRPVMTGYQTVARVVEKGDKVANLQVGDLVFIGEGASLWNMKTIGGTHARRSVWEADTVFRIDPKCPSLKSASYSTLAAVALDEIGRMKLARDKALAVFGLGMLGQIAG